MLAKYFVLLGRIEMLEALDINSEADRRWIALRDKARRQYGKNLIRDVDRSTRSSDTSEKRKQTLKQFIDRANQAKQRIQTQNPLRPGEVRKWNKETQSWESNLNS